MRAELPADLAGTPRARICTLSYVTYMLCVVPRMPAMQLEVTLRRSVTALYIAALVT